MMPRTYPEHTYNRLRIPQALPKATTMKRATPSCGAKNESLKTGCGNIWATTRVLLDSLLQNNPKLTQSGVTSGKNGQPLWNATGTQLKKLKPWPPSQSEDVIFQRWHHIIYVRFLDMFTPTLSRTFVHHIGLLATKGWWCCYCRRFFRKCEGHTFNAWTTKSDLVVFVFAYTNQLDHASQNTKRNNLRRRDEIINHGWLRHRTWYARPKK